MTKERNKGRGIPDWMGVTGLGVLLLAIALGCMKLQTFVTRHYSSGAAEGSSVIDAFDDAGARTVLLVDRIGSRNTGYERRVSVVDPASGEVVKRFFDGAGGCVPGAAGRLWCQFGFGKKDGPLLHTDGDIPVAIGEAHDDGILLLDRKTLATVLNLDDAIDGAALGTRATARWRIRQGIAWYLLDDARSVRVDPATLKVAVADGAPTALVEADPVMAQLDLAQELRSPVECATKATGSRKALLAPALLVDNGDGKPMAVDGDAVVVRAEKIVARGKSEKDVVARLSSDGKTVWTVVLGGRCERATRVKDLVVITSTNEDQRALGIDAATGAIRWKVAF